MYPMFVFTILFTFIKMLFHVDIYIILCYKRCYTMDTAGLLLLPFHSIIVITNYIKMIPYTNHKQSLPYKIPLPKHCSIKFTIIINLSWVDDYTYIVRLWHYTYPYTNYINKFNKTNIIMKGHLNNSSIRGFIEFN